MNDKFEKKLLQLLDFLSVEVVAGRRETSDLRSEMRGEFVGLRREMRVGFDRIDRIDRRLGNLETRLEGLEGTFRAGS